MATEVPRIEAEERPLEAALRDISIFADLTEEQLQWFVSQATELRLAPGDILIHEGDPADALFVLLTGEIRGRQESSGPDAPLFVARAGQVTGMLPFSRMTRYQVVSRAALPTRIARFPKDRFNEMLERIPQLLPRLVAVLADRVRETARASQQRDKLMALGKLSAGLAHELNNPAAAARRSAEGLRQALMDFRRASAELNRKPLTLDQRMFLSEFEQCTMEKLFELPVMDALEQSDREEQVASWLEAKGIRESWKLAPSLVESGFDLEDLETTAAKFDTQSLRNVLERFVAAITTEKLTREIEGSTGRISELVKAVKEYSYMDRTAEQEIDIHQGIESTLTMLKFRLKKGVNVTRDFDKTLPKISAHGSELNQVWTNLIDNAIDAMDGKGELNIRTARELDNVLVEIVDNGRGIPEQLKARIFEPFFTTKGVGEGTGLGLDAVYRIVRNHHGEVGFESQPGETRFQVRLPFKQPKERKHESV